MIQKEKVQRGKIDDKFFRQAITGKIDDILLQKTPVELTNIINIGDRQRLVLIEGAPGSGKSTLALHICQEWAEGKLFQEFDIVILVRLRDPLIMHANNIENLLPCRNSLMASQIGVEVSKTDGEGVLWVLDGWDELPSKLPQDSIIYKLIQPGMSHENPLHKSIVIVTSRPSCSAQLHPLVSSRVEVLGFTPHQLEQYFTECLRGDAQAVHTLMDRIQENPALESSCYLPLHASVVVNCFLSDNHSLPSSNHGIFISVVQSSLKRYMQDRLGTATPVGNITSPDTLPLELCTPFLQMCQLAHYGIEQNKATFTDEHLASFSIPKNVSDIGLIQSVPSIIGDGHLVYYCFLHLSIQELLAAIHISLKSPKYQISTFQNMFGKPRFSAVFQFYAGITKLTANRSILNKLPRFLRPVPASIFELVRTVIKRECEKKYSEPKPLLLSLINCLYEAEDSSLCEFVADLLNHKLVFSYTAMNPINSLSIGYFASVCTNNSKEFSLDLSSCFIGDQGCKFLVQGLSKCSHSLYKLRLNLWYNNIHDEGLNYITALLQNLTVLDLSRNSITRSGLSAFCKALSINTSLKRLSLDGCSLSLDDHEAIPQLLKKNTWLRYLDLSRNIIGHAELSNICEALSTNTSLKTLNLSYCSLTISEANGAALYQLLSKNKSLEELRLSANTVNSCHHIAAGLATNKTLRKLSLANCELTDCSVEELLTGLINNIEYLTISHNQLITENGMKILARHLTTNCPNLITLWIPNRLHLQAKTMFCKTNEERKKNKVHKINVL